MQSAVRCRASTAHTHSRTPRPITNTIYNVWRVAGGAGRVRSVLRVLRMVDAMDYLSDSKLGLGVLRA